MVDFGSSPTPNPHILKWLIDWDSRLTLYYPSNSDSDCLPAGTDVDKEYK